MEEGLIIYIDWKYFLGIMGLFIYAAWYSNGRFTKLEVDMTWVKDILTEMKTGIDNASGTAPAFGPGSPINLKPTGERWLLESGWKQYIESKKPDLMKLCEEKRATNPYEVQKHIFKMFDILELDTEFDDKLKKYAYEKGTTTSVLRRVGAIYFRNLCLDTFGMNQDDIDKHDPETSK